MACFNTKAMISMYVPRKYRHTRSIYINTAFLKVITKLCRLSRAGHKAQCKRKDVYNKRKLLPDWLTQYMPI